MWPGISPESLVQAPAGPTNLPAGAVGGSQGSCVCLFATDRAEMDSRSLGPVTGPSDGGRNHLRRTLEHARGTALKEGHRGFRELCNESDSTASLAHTVD